MRTSFAASPDGIRIAYDVSGDGEPLVLLHGGGAGLNRRSWHKAGYVKRLRHDFKVITIDIRGNGESDKPIRPEDYSIDKHCQDILTVADACGVERFTIWGFSYGGNIGRYLATESPRVAKLIMIGVTFGPGASEEVRQFVLSFRDYWLPILQAQTDGTLEVQSLSQEDQDHLQSGDMPAVVAWTSALLNWGSVEPGDVRCPTLWLVGSRNDSAMAGVREYEAALESSKVELRLVDGLDHMQEFNEIDRVLPIMLAFTRAERK